MTQLSDFQIGQTVELADGQTASVQFIGNTHFAQGDWVGVVFDEAIGKNDGSVQGQRYFECPAGHGMFIRPTVATIVDQPTPKPAVRMNGKANGTAIKGRPPNMASAGIRRQSIADSAGMKRRSINASSPTPAARVSRLANPGRSPTRQLSSAVSSGSSTPSRTGTPSNRKSIPPPTSSKHTSMGPPQLPSAANRAAARPSIVDTTNGSARSTGQGSLTSRAPSSGLSMRPRAKERLSSASGESRTSLRNGNDSPADGLRRPSRSPLDMDYPETTSAEENRAALASPLLQSSVLASPTSQLSGFSQMTSQRPVPSRGRSPGALSQRPTASATNRKELEEMETKLRLMEKRREEDREKLKEMDKAKAEKDRFEGIIQKLQTKYQPLQQEMADLRRQLKEAEAKVQILEAQQAENDSINEMATLDKEMAEELADSIRLELQTLRQKNEELELEVEVLHEENQELGQEINPEDKTSQGWLQLERSNERYREALIRLRDVTGEQEAELRDQIATLEQELQDHLRVKEESTAAKERLAELDAVVEDLRQQLDAALGAEDLIEELTENNLALNEKIDELRATVEDLEALKELNDELEINHTENEKQLQDEIDYHESLLADEARKSVMQDGVIQDLEYTVSRFRELVNTMQNDLEDMRSSQQITEAQANELGAKSRAMMDMNMKLQTSATKTQIKAIDLELGKMQAQESAEHLAIAQLFLPEAFQSERESIQALLRFKRIGFKAKMLHGFLKERIANPPTLGQQADFFAYCEMLNGLTWIDWTCQRFVNTEKTCDLDTFKRLGAASYELEPVERALNGWIDALKQDELHGGKCVGELPGFIALMAHLAEIHISESLEHHADHMHMRSVMLQSHLENTAAALMQVKSICDSKITLASIGDQEEEDLSIHITSRIDSLVSQARSAKVISSKAVRQLEELISRCVTLNPSTTPTVEQSEHSGADLCTAAVQLGYSTLELLAEEAQIETSTAQALSTTLQSGQFSLSSITSKLQATTTHLHSFYNLTTNLTQAVEFPAPPSDPPWKLLAQHVKEANADLVAREVEMSQLKDEVAGKNTALAVKEQIAEEMGVKLEVLEKRVGESTGRKERVKELEEASVIAKAKEQDLHDKLTRLQSELQQAEADREKWKTSIQTKSPSVDPGHPPLAGSSGQRGTSQASLLRVSALELEIKALQSCIRYLQTAAHTRNVSDSLEFLSQPITSVAPGPPKVKTEAKGVIREMLGLIAQPNNQPVKLQTLSATERNRWRPAKDTTAWQIQRQKEDWEEWREWRDDVAKKAALARRHRKRVAASGAAGNLKDPVPLAKLQVQLPKKIGSGKAIDIVDATEWEDIQQTLGVMTW